jgi:hypothetical protein
MDGGRASAGDLQRGRHPLRRALESVDDSLRCPPSVGLAGLLLVALVAGGCGIVSLAPAHARRLPDLAIG